MQPESAKILTEKNSNILGKRTAEIVRVQISLISIKDGILMNPRSRELLEELAKVRSKPVSEEGVPLEDRAAKKIIRDDKGRIGIPLRYLTASLTEAGREVKNGTKKISTEKKTSIYQFLDFHESFFPFTDQNAPWVTDLQGGNGGQRGKPIAVAIIRPLFPHWSIEVIVDIDTKECSISTAKKLFEVAGRIVGVGDYRAKSNFGKFKIAEWIQIDN